MDLWSIQQTYAVSGHRTQHIYFSKYLSIYIFKGCRFFFFFLLNYFIPFRKKGLTVEKLSGS